VQRLIASLILACAGAGALSGCASAPSPAPGASEVVAAESASAPADSRAAPQLRLAPSLLGRTLNLQQHLTLQARGHDQQLDVLLEADARHVQMGMVAMGQVAARLSWDGITLDESKAPWWPQAVSGSRILSDLQLTLWPASAIQAALPAGWTLVEDGNVRTLRQGDEVVTVVTRLCPLSSCAKSQDPRRAATLIELDQRREHFKLEIESRDLGDAADTRALTKP
jgi:hypothetical protein